MVESKTIVRSRCYNNNTKNILATNRFSEEGLQGWAIRRWEEEEEPPYIDLFSYTLTPSCVKWLESVPSSPSNELATAFYGSIRFTPERWFLSLLVNKNYSSLPDGKSSFFELGQRYLFWTVASLSSHQFIATYGSKDSFLGCTMVGFDPKSRKVYHGNCVHSKFATGFLFQILLPFHKFYAKFLLIGMAKELERRATTRAEEDK